jgi:hypothetical protein
VDTPDVLAIRHPPGTADQEAPLTQADSARAISSTYLELPVS